MDKKQMSFVENLYKLLRSCRQLVYVIVCVDDENSIF